ncbi:MAG TPA: transporter [Pirellulales bacterium]|jgi:hypothetical protein|nr:transporter [Pirellulales bacterium]
MPTMSAAGPAPAAAAPATPASAKPATTERRQITVSLPIPRKATSGEVIVDPNVNVSVYHDGVTPTDNNGAPVLDVSPYHMRPVSAVIMQPGEIEAPSAAPSGPLPEVLPAPVGVDGLPMGMPPPDWTQPLGPGAPPGPGGPCNPCPPKHRHGRRDPVNGVMDYGVGHERVQVAPFGLDVSQPFTNIKLRTDFGYGEQDPDRDEYFWAKTSSLGGKGLPLPEKSVNYQEVDLYIEQALNPSFSVATNLPLRFINPVVNPDTAGFGDMSVTTKLVMLNGRKWQITQLFRTYIPTGSFLRGLGTGHVSLQPGLLARYQWTPETYLHGNLEFWVPIGGDPTYDGLIVNYNFGVSHIWYDSDDFAVLPTMEFLGSSAMTGMQTSPSGVPQVVDTLTIVNLMPGLRFVRDTCGDCGLFEAGIASGVAVTTNRWYAALLRLELRWMY